MAELPAHLAIEAFIQELMGERRKLLGPVAPLLIDTAVGLADQFSVYLEQRPGAKLTLGTVELREGDKRSYVYAGIKCNGGPLRMLDVQAAWDQKPQSNDHRDFVESVNARRWRFVNRYRTLLIDLFRQVADQMVTYVERKPGVHLEPNPDQTVRLVEGVNETYVVLELDDRGGIVLQDSLARHRLN